MNNRIDRGPLLSLQADRGRPGGPSSGKNEDKHQHQNTREDFIEKDASSGTSRPSHQDSDTMQGKDGGALNRAGDERGWNAKQQPRDNHGRFKSEKNAGSGQGLSTDGGDHGAADHH